MKIEQEPKFQPIKITLETQEEAVAFEMIIIGADHISPAAQALRNSLRLWLDDEAQL